MMNKDEIDLIKKRIVSDLKNRTETLLLENFVENYDGWQEKMKNVNSIINAVDPSIVCYTYDEFCKIIIEITKDSLKNFSNYDNLFLTESEFKKIKEDCGGNENEMDKTMLEVLNKKFMNNFMILLHKSHIKDSAKHKLQEQFTLDIEETLDRSLEIAESILKDYNEKSNL